jgi:hypothetical protein
MFSPSPFSKAPAGCLLSLAEEKTTFTHRVKHFVHVDVYNVQKFSRTNTIPLSEETVTN